ncbi:MAG: hypothetical protein IJR87_10640 [Bacteroidaceae bacterium]|nr:hypothetical protein [Bacteroidaceae bacterium]
MKHKILPVAETFSAGTGNFFRQSRQLFPPVQAVSATRAGSFFIPGFSICGEAKPQILQGQALFFCKKSVFYFANKP